VKPTGGIDEKLLKSRDRKSGPKYIQISQKWKTLQHKIGDDLTQNHGYIDANQEFIKCGNHPNIVPLFRRLGRSLTSLLSSLWHEAHPHLPKWRPKWKGVGEGYSHNSHMVLFIAKTKWLECSCGLKGKLHLMKGSLVWLPLRRTRLHRTDHLSLHFHMTSTMMPCTPPVIAPSLVFRQNWETLARLALWWSRPPDVNACPHTVFIRASVLRRKSTNLLPLCFEAQTKKPSRWFCGANHQTTAASFEA
jgi:hypothetical protein